MAYTLKMDGDSAWFLINEYARPKPWVSGFLNKFYS